MMLFCILKVIISTCRKWDQLSSGDQRDFLRSYSSQLCFDCGQTGEPGFCQFYGHDCLRKGYAPGEAAGFIKFCVICSQYYDSITEMMFHNVNVHKCFPTMGCVIIGCGRSYFNNQYHDLHIIRLHGGCFNFNLLLKKMYGPRPSCF